MVFQLLHHFWAYQRPSWEVTLIIDALGLGKGECPFGWVSNTYSLQSVICVLVASWVSAMIRYVLCPFCRVSLLVCWDLRKVEYGCFRYSLPSLSPRNWEYLILRIFHNWKNVVCQDKWDISFIPLIFGICSFKAYNRCGTINNSTSFLHYYKL